MSNEEIAAELLEQARRLTRTGGNLYRVRAYRHAAMTIMGLHVSVADVLRKEGRRGLMALPGIGTHLAGDIAEFIRTGAWLGHQERRRRAG